MTDRKRRTFLQLPTTFNPDFWTRSLGLAIGF